MPFLLPNFNIPIDYWKPGNTPLAGPPDGTAMGQKYIHSRADIDQQPGFVDQWVPPVWWRISNLDYINVMNPPLKKAIIGYTDSLSIVWYYSVRWWDHMHDGFANQYLALLCEQCDNAGNVPDTGR